MFESSARGMVLRIASLVLLVTACAAFGEYSSKASPKNEGLPTQVQPADSAPQLESIVPPDSEK